MVKARCKSINPNGTALGRKLYRMAELFESCTLIFILIPTFYIHGIVNVIPGLTAKYEYGPAKKWMHIILSTFVFINVAGNYIMSVFSDTSFKVGQEDTDDWTFCETCQKRIPPRCWHCNNCNKCILKRDHHCMFMASCIGYYNFRFYVLYLGHMSCGLIYSLYYNYYYFNINELSSIQMMFLFVGMNPLAGLLADALHIQDFKKDFSIEMIALYLLFMNVILILWTSSLFCFHIGNVFRGSTVKEKERGVIRYNLGWRHNFVDVFGSKWYLAIVCPFVYSPLPGDGLRWVTSKY